MDDWVDVEKPTDGKQLATPATNTQPIEPSNLSVAFYTILRECAFDRLKNSPSAVFHVDLGQPAVYTTFLNTLPASMRQEYNCSACRRLANRYGDIALVKADGTLEPVLWCFKDLEKKNFKIIYGDAVRAVEERFTNKKVVKELKAQNLFGSCEQNPFSHIHLRLPESRVLQKQEVPGHASAKISELAAMLDRVLSDYSLDTVRKAHSLLKNDNFLFADNHQATIQWLLNLLEGDTSAKARNETSRHNLLYRDAATSFIGSLKQLRSGALGLLLDNVKYNVPFDQTLREWSLICNPACYMRPTANPSEGNIAAAESLFKKLGLSGKELKRRLLVQDDVPDEVLMWKSEKMRRAKTELSTSIKTSAKIFAGVEAKEKRPDKPISCDAPPMEITFTRFVNKILPMAKHVDCWLGPQDAISSGVTGLKNTKPLMMWHDEGGKNLASFYNWIRPPIVESHNLKSNAWNEVRCLIPYPHLWDGAPLTTMLPLTDPDGEHGGKYKYYHKSLGFQYVFVLEENHETRFHTTPIFPQYLKGEFHGVRSTIEAHCKRLHMLDVDDGLDSGGFVAGITAHRNSTNQRLRMRVTTFKNAVETYKITLFE